MKNISLIFFFLFTQLFAQKEIKFHQKGLKSTLDSLETICEVNPKKFFRLIDSLKPTVSEKDTPLFMVQYHYLKGCAYRNLGKFKELYHHFEKTKEYAISYEYRQYLAEVYREMGDEYIDSNMYKKAIESYENGKKKYAEFNNERGVLTCSYEGFIESLQGDYALSTTILKANLERYKKSHPLYLDALSTISQNYLALKDIDSAFAYAQKLPFHIKDINNYNYQFFYYYVANKYYVDKKNIEKAAKYSDSMGGMRFEYENNKYYFESKIAVAKLSNDVKTQLSYSDSIKKITQKHIEELETKKVFDTEEIADNKSTIISQKKTFFKGALAFVFLLFILVLVVFFGVKKYNRYKKQQNSIIAQMQKELQSSLIKLQKQPTKKNTTTISDRIIELAKKNNLTERESDVLLQITNGLNNKQIAEELFVSVNTIKYHTRNLYEKLNIKKRTEVTSKVLQS